MWPFKKKVRLEPPKQYVAYQFKVKVNLSVKPKDQKKYLDKLEKLGIFLTEVEGLELDSQCINTNTLYFTAKRSSGGFGPSIKTNYGNTNDVFNHLIDCQNTFDRESISNNVYFSTKDDFEKYIQSSDFLSCTEPHEITYQINELLFSSNFSKIYECGGLEELTDFVREKSDEDIPEICSNCDDDPLTLDACGDCCSCDHPFISHEEMKVFANMYVNAKGGKKHYE